jgi:hypothetical protein
MAKFILKTILSESDASVRHKVSKAIVNRLNHKLLTVQFANRLSKQAGDILVSKIQEQSEYQEIVAGGKLAGILGLQDGGRRLARIVGQIKNSVDVSVSKFQLRGGLIGGYVRVFAIRADFSDVLSMEEASFISENEALVPWLNWILLQGDRILIATHRVSFNPKLLGYSRTGQAVMIKTSRGPFFRIPPQYSGTADDNFITRGGAQALPEIGHTIKNEIRSRF